MIIDTHQHLLYPSEFTYEWAGDIPALQNAFTIEDYWKIAGSAQVTGTLFMEVDVPESEQGKEARFFCRLSEDPKNKILGVIASARPENEGFESYLDSIAHPALKGVRRVLHVLPELPINDNFYKNVALLGKRNLTFDLIVTPQQVSKILPLVKVCPDTTFVLNHCGIPPIADEEFDLWKEGLALIAAEANVFCKVSGIVVYCAPGTANTDTLRPWFDAVVRCFGHDHLIFGGDWPVCNLTSSLDKWIRIATELVAGFTPEQQAAFWAGNAKSVYNLK